MLPSRNRLLTKKEFEEVKKGGRKYQNALFGLLVLRTNLLAPRFGFIVSTKLSKKAVRRNQAKRLLREAVRQVLPKVHQGVDVIFLVKKELLGKSFFEIQAAIEKDFKTAEIINEE